MSSMRCRAGQVLLAAAITSGCGSSSDSAGLDASGPDALGSDAGSSDALANDASGPDGAPLGADGALLSDGGGSIDATLPSNGDAATDATPDSSDGSPVDSPSSSQSDSSLDAAQGDSSVDAAATDSSSSAPDGSEPTDSGWGTPVDGGPAYSGPTVTGTVSVNRGTPAGKIGPGFAGFSFEKTHMTNDTFTGQNTALIALFKLVAPTVIRIGADDVDKCMWDPAATPPAHPSGQPFSRNIGTAEVDGLGDMLKATGARVIYGVNFNSATTANSAAEAAYATTKLGAGVYGFEIGNEINRFGSWTTLKPKWESFADAILAAAPSAHLIGPAGGGGEQTGLSTPFAHDEASKLLLLTQHYYAGTANTSSATLAKLLVPDPFPITSGQGLIEMCQVMSTAAVSNKIPDGFRIGECNTFSGHGQDGLSNALISALWSLDFMFTSAKYGASGVNFHGGEVGMDGNKQFYYSPIEEENGVVTNANPLFYGMLLFTLAGSGQALATTATANGLDFTAYSIELADGSTSVVLDNKDTTSGVRATVNIGTAVGSASAIYLTGPTPASLTALSGLTIAGAAISPAGVWTRQPRYSLSTSGNTVSVLVPPASAALVRVQ